MYKYIGRSENLYKFSRGNIIKFASNGLSYGFKGLARYFCMESNVARKRGRVVYYSNSGLLLPKGSLYNNALLVRNVRAWSYKNSNNSAGKGPGVESGSPFIGGVNLLLTGVFGYILYKVYKLNEQLEWDKEIGERKDRDAIQLREVYDASYAAGFIGSHEARYCRNKWDRLKRAIEYFEKLVEYLGKSESYSLKDHKLYFKNTLSCLIEMYDSEYAGTILDYEKLNESPEYMADILNLIYQVTGVFLEVPESFKEICNNYEFRKRIVTLLVEFSAAMRGMNSRVKELEEIGFESFSQEYLESLLPKKLIDKKINLLHSLPQKLAQAKGSLLRQMKLIYNEWHFDEEQENQMREEIEKLEEIVSVSEN